MKEIKVEQTLYEAEDGMRFANREECRVHDDKIQARKNAAGLCQFCITGIPEDLQFNIPDFDFSIESTLYVLQSEEEYNAMLRQYLPYCPKTGNCIKAECEDCDRAWYCEGIYPEGERFHTPVTYPCLYLVTDSDYPNFAEGFPVTAEIIRRFEAYCNAFKTAQELLS